MEEDEQDTQDAAEHQQQQTEQRRQEAEGWEWWPGYYDAKLARQRVEAAKLKALNWALDRIFK